MDTDVCQKTENPKNSIHNRRWQTTFGPRHADLLIRKNVILKEKPALCLLNHCWVKWRLPYNLKIILIYYTGGGNNNRIMIIKTAITFNEYVATWASNTAFSSFILHPLWITHNYLISPTRQLTHPQMTRNCQSKIFWLQKIYHPLK